jgi:predicted ATPase/DNA-binding CsgD family transcriptional regulator
MARPRRQPGNLPAEATSFVGRRVWLAQVRQKLSASRLVTLVGPGGVGKTRLAIRAASDVARGFRHGAWLVELADVRDPALLGDALMAALGLRDQARAEPHVLLRSFLHDKELLLVLDNCEHLLDGVAELVAGLVRSAPGVRILATSREPLSSPGEHLIPIPPLELPPPLPADPRAVPPLAQLRRNEAVTLFVDRAAASGPFELTPANGAAVAELCRRLDGLPLAIELAAVRTRVLSVEQILARLSDRFSLLTGGSRAALPRHQTLHTTMEWSHDLLSERERTHLCRLCVFAGHFTLEDVEGVCATDNTPAADTLDVLSSLVDKSLVVKELAKSVACYRLHETVREFARLKLREAGEEDAVERRCVEYYAVRCQRAAVGARYRLVEWLDWAELEIDNVRAVLQRCVSHRDAARGLAIATSMSWYWITRATTEGARWLDELMPPGSQAHGALAWPYFIRGFLAVLKADPATARARLALAAAAARDPEQPLPLAQSLAMGSVAELIAGDRAAAHRLLDEAQRVAATVDDPSVKVAALQAQALCALSVRDLGAVTAACTSGVRLSRASGDLYSLEQMLFNLGVLAIVAGDLSSAHSQLVESLHIARQIDDRLLQAYLLGALGCCAAAQHKPPLAARLLGASEALRARTGADLNPLLAPLLAHARSASTSALGDTRFEAEFHTGANLSDDAALALALGEASRATPDRAPTGAPAGAVVTPLAKRESEVAQLVAQGLSNKQIAARLFLSERTIDSHVRRILNMLAVSSRAQIAAWVASSSDSSP